MKPAPPPPPQKQRQPRKSLGLGLTLEPGDNRISAVSSAAKGSSMIASDSTPPFALITPSRPTIASTNNGSNGNSAGNYVRELGRHDGKFNLKS